MILPPQPPSPPEPPKVLQERKEEKRKSRDDFIPELGLTYEQFAEIALSNPIDWSPEQLDVLQLLLNGQPVDEEIVQELAYYFLNPQEKPVEGPRKRTEPRIPRELMDPEELAEELAGTFIPITREPLIAPEVPNSNVNLDDWLRKKG